MRSEDLEEFKRQAGVMVAGFPGYVVTDRDALLEALWRGLQRMDLLVFARVVDYAVSGEAQIQPKMKLTAAIVWEMSRKLRSRAPITEPPVKSGDRFAVITTKFLWLFMYKKGPFAPAVLQALLDAKRKLIDDYRLIAAEEEITDTEFGEQCYRKFAAITGCNDVKFDDERRSAA